MTDKKTFNVVLTLTEPMLGTVPKNKDVYAAYIAGLQAKEKLLKAKVDAAGNALDNGSALALLEEEAETVDHIEEKGWTGFHKDEDGHFVYDYAMKGFLSEAARTVKIEGIKQLQDKVKRHVFVQPRRIRIDGIEDCPLERPLRAMTAQGPRVTLVRSDVVPAGSVLRLQLVVWPGGQITRNVLVSLYEYAEFIGLGQWRSGGYGRCKAEIEEA